MSLATKNVATVLVGCAVVLALSFAVATPAKADLLSDLQAQVQALLAQIAALQGGSSSSGSGCYAFTMTHQMGDNGGEVMQIQKFLNSHGAQVAASGPGSPGNETSYFGALTRAAVAKWQAANGVSPAAGYWGPITRAKVASVCASSPSTPTAPGGNQGLNGTAGTATITSTSEDVEDEVLSGQTEKIVGMKVEASGSDLRVTNIRVRFDKDSGASAASSDTLAAYFSEVSIWANGTKIGSMPASSFTRDAAGVYSASIPVDQIVRMGSANKVTFHVGATANSSLDSDDIGSTNDWLVQVTQVRYTDASGAVLFEDPNTTVNNGGATAATTGAGVYVNRSSSATDVKLRMAEGSGNPKSGNVKVNESNTTEVTLAEFTLKAENADMYFDRLTASTTLTGVDQVSDMVQTFFLMRGSTRIAELAASTATAGSQILNFVLDDIENLSSGSTQTYRIVAKVNSIATGSGVGTAFDQGDTITASTSPSVGDINARATSDGKSVTERAGSVTTYTQTLFSEGIQVTKVGESFTPAQNDTPANSSGEFKMTLRITNFGSNDVYIPLTTLATTSVSGLTASQIEGVNFFIENGSLTATTSPIGSALTRVSGGTELTNSVRISGGASADFVLTASFNPDASFTGNQQYRVQLVAVGHSTADDATPESVVYATPEEDFRTSFNTINN
ncbi:MAG TPA: peptidoglycan-binding domain-containing protein [Candidatus Paceibacterota bacterium]|nr:peptidoglycan-binding domain-containing protein [Candidatus Paceibacterota bacterium]